MGGVLMTDQEARDGLALAIARTMGGWNDDTTEPGMGDPLMRRMAEEHWEKVNAECLRQGRQYADAALAWMTENGCWKHPAPEVTDALASIFRESALNEFVRVDPEETYESLVLKANALAAALKDAQTRLAAPAPEITDEMLERTARAMLEAAYGEGVWEHREPFEEDLYRRRARAALEAALNPKEDR